MTTILNKEKILEQARAFVEEGKLDKAIREYEKILLADPADLKVKLRMAELSTKRKQINDAIRIYREVAEAYAAEGFFLKAVTVYKSVLRLNPSLIEVNEGLAQLYQRMGLTADAIRQYDILASSLDLKGEKERVVELRKKIVGLNPRDGKARVRLAELYQREGRTEEAVDHYEEYAKLLEEQGAADAKLAEIFEKILAHRPDNWEMVKKVIAIYERLHEHKKALKWLEQKKELVDQDAGLLAFQAMIYISQNQQESARLKYMRLAELEAASDNIEAALDAYVEILVMLPDEEDRLQKKVEELRPGAMPELVERAIQKRQELEQEELRQQEAEDHAGEASHEEERTPPQPTAAPKQEEATSPAAPPSKREEEPCEALPPKEEPKAQPPKAPPQQEEALPEKPVAPSARPERAKADAAYHLGMTYQKMGLDSEAEQELLRALEIYAACQANGMSDPDLEERQSAIQAILQRGDVEEKALLTEIQSEEAKQEEEPPVKAPAKRGGSKSEGKRTSSSRREKPKVTKKKRISYV